MNNANFKLKNIMDYLDDENLNNPHTATIFHYNIFNDKVDTSFVDLSNQSGFTIENSFSDESVLEKSYLKRLLRIFYVKYRNYEIAFDTVGSFLSELFLRINKDFSVLKYKLDKIKKSLDVTDEELATLRKTIYANSANNASIDIDDTDEYLNNIVGYVDNQTGGKKFDNKFNAYMNYYRKIRNDTLLDFVNSLKDLFICVIPNRQYIYTY